jgi:hypothetical protein
MGPLVWVLGWNDYFLLLISYGFRISFVLTRVRNGLGLQLNQEPDFLLLQAGSVGKCGYIHTRDPLWILAPNDRDRMGSK